MSSLARHPHPASAASTVHHAVQTSISLSVILLSTSSEIPERILWLVDESVMKGEMPGAPDTNPRTGVGARATL
jgi:hypothetical protein